jgi:hypothetical protein
VTSLDDLRADLARVTRHYEAERKKVRALRRFAASIAEAVPHSWCGASAKAVLAATDDRKKRRGGGR